MTFDQPTRIGETPFGQPRSRVRPDNGLSRTARDTLAANRQARLIARQMISILRKENLKVKNTNPYETSFTGVNR